MPQNPCYREIFQPNTPVFFSDSVLRITTPGAGEYDSRDTLRPMMPYCGCTQDATDIFVPDSIINNQNNINAIVEYFRSVRSASINFVLNAAGTSHVEPDSPYSGYLYKNTNDELPQKRDTYFQGLGIIQQFWVNANLAWTPEQYNNALSGLKDQLTRLADKTLFIPNMKYEFDAGDPFSVLYTAWLVTTPTLTGFLAVNFYQ